jgi:hypothetical protein
MAKRLTEQELGAKVQAEIARSIEYDRAELATKRIRAMEYMEGKINDLPLIEGRSSATSSDVADTIGFMMPGLMRVFFSGDDIVTYQPVTKNDEQTAKQATEYVNLILKELDAYETFWDVFQDSLLHANGIVKHWWEPYEKVDVFVERQLSENQLAFLTTDPEVEIIEGNSYDYADDTPQIDPASGQLLPPVVTTLYDVKFKRTEKLGRICIKAVPPEQFLIDTNATTLKEANFVGHRMVETRSNLIEQGFDRDLVKKLPASSGSLEFDEVVTARRDISGAFNDGTGMDESMDLVEIIECYIKFDYNGDGIAETLKVIIGGNGSKDILDWEEWGKDYPFTDFVAERVPHRWLGRSVFDEVETIQKVKTVLLRQYLDNLYQSNIPDRIVNENAIVDQDELYDRGVGNVIRVKGDPNGAISTYAVPNVAKEAITGLQLMDDIIKRRTGVGQDTMALDQQALQNQTATAVMAAQSGAYAKVELVARNFAEMGFKNFFKALLKLLVENQDRPTAKQIGEGKWVEFNPKSWNANMDCTVSVGLGSGSKEKDVMMLQAIAAKQEQIMAMAGFDNPLCGPVQYANTLKKLVEAGGIKNTNQFFNEIDPQALAAQAGQGQKPDPKQQEAMAKIQLANQEAQAKVQLMQAEQQAKLQLEREKAAADLQLQREKFALEMEQEKQKNLLELQHKREVAQLNAQLDRDKMQAEIALTEQSNLLSAYHNMNQADTKIRGQIVPESE